MKGRGVLSQLWVVGLVMVLLLSPMAVWASDVDVAVVDVTAPTGSVTLAPGASASITINMSVTGNQVGTATFEVYRDWTLSGGTFTGSNPQEFTVDPRAGGASATTFSTSGTVTVAAGQADGPFTLAVGAFDITNSNTTGAKLAAGDSSDYQVTVQAPVDTTPPVITPDIEGTLGNNGWYVSNVTVSWTVVDEESEVTDEEGCDETTVDYDTIGVTFTCEATSAGGTASESVTIKRDATAPTISASLNPEDPATTGWYNAATGAPTVSFACYDQTSGLVGACPADHTFGEGADLSHSQTIYDNAGNSASALVSGINVDLTSPTLGECPSGGPFILGSGAWSVGPIVANDATSGINEAGSTLSGSIDASSVGTKSVTFTAVDNAGNGATKQCEYSVIYDWDGFFRPVENVPTLNVVKAGQAVPVKFSLSGDQGLSVFASGYPSSAQKACDSSAPADNVEETVTAGGSSLSYDAAADQYIYVWKTNKAWAGSCRQLVVKLIDGTEHKANFSFKK